MTDILLDDNDLTVTNGDFTIGDPVYQNQQLLLVTHKGEWKQSPMVGVGIDDYLLDEGPADMLRAIRTEFNKDGMTVSRIEIVNGKLQIAAYYAN